MQNVRRFLSKPFKKASQIWTSWQAKERECVQETYLVISAGGRWQFNVMAGTVRAGTDAVEGRLGTASDLKVQVIDHETSSFLARDLNVLSGRVV